MACKQQAQQVVLLCCMFRSILKLIALLQRTPTSEAYLQGFLCALFCEQFAGLGWSA